MSLGAGVRKTYLFVLVFGVFAPRALAAFAVCQAGWEWASNSKQQNPCEIAGALEAACQGFSVYELGPLQQGTNYVTPQRNSSAQKCECNTVVYSLYMACTACQNVTTQSWRFWSQFCTEVYVTQYPGNIPFNTAVPHWTYLDFTVGDKFDPVTAQAAGGTPEVLAPVPSTVSIPSSSTGPVLPTTSNPTGPSNGQDNNDDDNGTKESSKVGPIVGGVIGGLAFLGAIGAGVWIFLRRRALARGDEYHSDYPGYSAIPLLSEQGLHPSRARLYDPSDPSTFPSHGDHEQTGVYTTSSGRYTGAAEL